MLFKTLNLNLNISEICREIKILIYNFIGSKFFKLLIYIKSK